MRFFLKVLIGVSVLGALLILGGFFYGYVSLSALFLHLLLLAGTIILSCVGLQLCGRVEMLEGLVYRLALRIGRIVREGRR